MTSSKKLSSVAAAAAAVLLRGSGRVHRVASAFSIVAPSTSLRRRDTCISSVRYFTSLASAESSDNNIAADSDSDSEGFDASQLPIVVPTKGVPIHLYTDINEIEPQALQQLRKLAESPLPVDFVSSMPDAHLGKGATIGTVFASDKYVSPNAIGRDIGCGSDTY